MQFAKYFLNLRLYITSYLTALASLSQCLINKAMIVALKG